MKNYTKTRKLEIIEFLIVSIVLFANCLFFNSYGFSTGRLFAALLILFSLGLTIEQNIFLFAFCLPFSGVLKLSESSITILPVLYLVVIVKLGIRGKLK